MTTDVCESSQDAQGSIVPEDLNSDDDAETLEQTCESTRESALNDESCSGADSPLFAQNVRAKDRLAKFRALNRKIKEQKKALFKDALDAISQKEDSTRIGLDGNSDIVFEQLKKDKTEISMSIVDHKSENLKRFGFERSASKKGDEFHNVVQAAIHHSPSRLSELQQACWEVTNFVPLKIHNSTPSAAAQASQVREMTEDPAVLKALQNMFNHLDMFSNQSDQFLTMLCLDAQVGVVTVAAGTRAATKGEPMTRTLVLLSGQAHMLSYAGESYILLEESESTRMKTGDCLGFINDNEDVIQQNAFTVACQTSCSFLEITKASFDEIYNQIKFERFMDIMNMIPEDRSDTDLEFLCNFAKKNAFFKQLKESRQINLCRQAKMEQCKFDDVLFNEDDRGQTYYIIIRGSVRVLKNVGGALDSQGNKIFQQVALLGPGVGFGELALLSSSGVRQATVIANENSVFMTLSRKTYNEVLRGEHEHSLNETIRAIIHVFPYVGQRDRIFQTYMAQLFREEELPAGHEIVKQGAKASTFYILKEGALSIDCRVEFSRFSPPEEAGFFHAEENFETKTLKKFTDKEHKVRLVPFGELSAFGDTIGDMDMLANPIWAATYMYRATVSKPAVLCSISWTALKVRFPPEMLEDLQSRSLKKLTLFKRIFESAIITETSNSGFCCQSDFNPTGFVPKKMTENSFKPNIKLSLGEQLEEKKMKLRRHVRTRMDVPAMQAFQITVEEWIVEMSDDKILRSIETVTDVVKQNTEVQLDTLTSLLLFNDGQKDSALQSLMRSAFLDDKNIDSCIDNIIKKTRTETEIEEAELTSNLETSRASQKLALKNDETCPSSPKRAIRTPIPGHKPQFVRYDLTEQCCNVVGNSITSAEDFVLLDSSIVSNRPSSRSTALTARSKSRQRSSSGHRFDASTFTSGDDTEYRHRYSSPVHDANFSDTSGDLGDPNVHFIGNETRDSEIPEYFYPDHYRIKSSENRVTKHRAIGSMKQRQIKLKARSESTVPFEIAIISTPIQAKSSNVERASSPLFCKPAITTEFLVAKPKDRMPSCDKGLLSVKSFKSEILSAANTRIMQQKLGLTQAAASSGRRMMSSDVLRANATSEIDFAWKSMSFASASDTKGKKKAAAFVQEKTSLQSTDAAEVAVLSDDDPYINYIYGTPCSPDVPTVSSSSIEPSMTHVEQPPPVSTEDKFKQILSSGFRVAREADENEKLIQAATLERLKQDHVQNEKQKSRAETKLKMATLFSTGLLDNRIRHLEVKDAATSERVDFELPSGLLEKMTNVIAKRMKDPKFKAEKFEVKMPNGIKLPEKAKKSATCTKSFDFGGFENTVSEKLMKFDDIVRSSYHNEQMMKIQNRNSDQIKANRQQLLKSVLSKSRHGPNVGILHVGGVALPSISTASPKQQR